MKKITSILLATLILTSALLYAIPVGAVDGYKEGDVIYLDISALPEWHTPNGTSKTKLYVNFNNNTRYTNGIKETVVIGEDLTRFNPKAITEQVDDYVYKYVVTAEDAGAKTLMFWRGSDTLLWNNSVELTYDEYSSGKNLVLVTGWTGEGSTSKADYNDYSIEAQLDITPAECKLGDEVTVTLSYKKAIDADVTYSYEILRNGEKVSDNSTYKFTVSEQNNSFTGTITAYYSDGTVAATSTVQKGLYIGEFKVVNSQENMLYAHAITDSGVDIESWVKWAKSSNNYYFYLPPSVSKTQIELLSTYSSNITVDGTTVAPYIPTVVNYSSNTATKVKVNNTTYNVYFMNSDSEASLFVNNDNSKTTNLWSYLSAAKENSSSASSAIVDKDGTCETVGIKKIKGRGNTTWNNSDKKPFNINFNSTVTVGTMQATKQYSLLANFQDPALARNRILYDLGDAVGLPYSCDSRFVDFYVDGVYKGQYQMCQKIEAGKKNLINGISDDDHLTDDNQLKKDFEFLIEVPFAEDFYTSTKSGIDVVIKSPAVEDYDNLYADEVKAYVRDKFDQFYTALKNNDPNLSKYVDIDSLASCYMIQELGKNWDTHSWYMVYEKDENGDYKFYGSPVWDFDNSIGNANGVASYLKKFGVTDYTEYSGWWCKYKTGSNDLSYLCTQNKTVMERMKTLWFEKFVPAIEIFASSSVDNQEIFSSDVYYNSLAKSADMNYRIWEMTANTSWIADHSSLKKATFDYDTLKYSVGNTTSYDQYSFKGQYDYMADWFTSRAAWISNEWKTSYVPPVTEPPTTVPPTTEPPTEPPTTIPPTTEPTTEPPTEPPTTEPTTPVEKILLGDSDTDGEITIRDATNIQSTIAKFPVEVFSEIASDVDQNDELNIRDATIVQMHIARYETGTNIGQYITVLK